MPSTSRPFSFLSGAVLAFSLSAFGPASLFGQSAQTGRSGDVNGDGSVDVSDAIYLINFQFLGGPGPVEIFCHPETSTGDVFWFTGEKAEGSSWLARGEDSITARLAAKGLHPGHTMTLWLMVFNNPEACNGGQGGGCGEPDLFDPAVISDALYADGTIVDDDGKVSFTAYLESGDTMESYNYVVGADPVGLLDPSGAEIHLVVRSHGPIVEDHAAEQIKTFAGGCVEFKNPPEIPAAAGECANVLYSKHPAAAMED